MMPADRPAAHLPRVGALSRRALLGLGGSAAAVATALAVWRRQAAGTLAPAAAIAPVDYVDHEGWMLTAAEKQALQAPGDAR